MISSSVASIAARLGSWEEGFVSYMATPRNLIGASLLRIVFALTIAAVYASHIAHRRFLWGPAGQLPLPQSASHIVAGRGWSLFLYSPAMWWFELVFWTGLLVTMLYLIGYRTRLTGVLFAVFTYSLLARNTYIGNGGTNALTICCMFLALAETNRYFSLDAALRDPEKQKPLSPALAILHNFAILAIILQLCVVYFFSTFYKITGEKWQNGTALYYILRSNQFAESPLNGVIWRNGTLVALLTFATLLYQSAFPWIIWHKRLKWIGIIAAFFFHGGIAMTMGLFWFSFVMVGLDVVLISDIQYLALSRPVRGAVPRLAQRSRLFARILTDA